MSKRILNSFAVGWEEVEAPIIANFVINRPFILTGRHGVCKTTVAEEFAKCLNEGNGYRFYDATKDDLITIAGIPKPEDLGKGIIDFARHPRSIWDAEVVVVDELTRANRENQNLWLEILEERSCFGIPLKKLQSIIATMNPESYAATFKLDEALLDRFYAVIPVPDLQTNTETGLYKQLIEMNFKRKELNGKVTDKLRKAISEIRELTNEYSNSDKMLDGVSDYVGALFEVIKNNSTGTAKNIYISPRKAVQLTEELYALIAYYKWFGHSNPEDIAGKTALAYTLAIPLKLDQKLLMQIHSRLILSLKKHSLTDKEKLLLELARLAGVKKSLFIIDNMDKIHALMPSDEADKVLMEVDIEKENPTIIGKFWKALKNVPGHEEVKRQADLVVISKCLDAVNKQVNEEIDTPIYNEDDILKESKLFDRVMSVREKSVTDLVDIMEKGNDKWF